MALRFPKLYVVYHRIKTFMEPWKKVRICARVPFLVEQRTVIHPIPLNSLPWSKYEANKMTRYPRCDSKSTDTPNYHHQPRTPSFQSKIQSTH